MPIRRSLPLLALMSLASIADGREPDEVAGLRVPPGFAVSEFSGGDLAHDIQCLTIDPRGRVVVAGRGYIAILADDDGDGRADRALPFADEPIDGAMGLLWEGDSLFVVGDGGLRRYRDADDDGRADGPSELVLPVKTGGEHHAHAVRRGPDGWLYLMIGNFAGVDASYASLPTSPIADPVAGCLLRLPPDLDGSEIVADGFRNAYDFDFNADGEIFTFDSDNERCVSLPWYEPTRFYHAVPGGHHGWLGPQRTDLWRLPPEAEDVVPPVAPIDRGSPTGVVCDRLGILPAPYRGGVFFLDWTFGRVFFAQPRRAGASYAATPEIFIEPTGSQGFAWTDAEIHPLTGDLYLSVGGRGTRGAVYRVRYGGEDRDTSDENEPRPPAAAPIDAAHDPSAVPPGAVGPEVPTSLLLDASDSPDDLQRLRSLIALKRRQSSVPADGLHRAIRANLDHPDRLIRSATAALIAGLDDPLGLLAEAPADPRTRLTLGFGLVDRDPEAALTLAADLLDSPDAPPELVTAAARLVQRALGGQPDPALKATVWEGYSAPRDASTAGPAPAIARIATALRDAPIAATDRERTRALAMLAVDDPITLDRIAARLTGTSDPIDDLHHLIVIGRLRAPRTPPVTRAVAEALLSLGPRLDARGAHRERNWPLRVAELYRGLADRDPGLHRALLSHPEFGRPDHALFALADGFDRAAAAVRFLDRAEADPDFAWDADVIAVVGSLPSERARDALRSLRGRAGLDDAILPILAADPIPDDRPLLLAGLRSSQPSTLAAALDGLDRLGPSDDAGELLALIAALRRSPDGPIRPRIAAMLEACTGRSLGDDPAAWASWFAGAYPDRAAALSGGDGVDPAAWARRLSSIDWGGGDAERGRALFERAQCASCHAGNRAVGPDLAGIASRFSRDDLFAAIVQPSRDVADRYRSLVVATSDGAVHRGIVIYDAADSLILQTGPTETIFVGGDAIEERRPSDLSLMPAGLIDAFTDREIADLDAYLRSR